MLSEEITPVQNNKIHIETFVQTKKYHQSYRNYAEWMVELWYLYFAYMRRDFLHINLNTVSSLPSTRVLA